MGFKISKLLLLIILIFLQSCSGGRIGNFFETSFKNIEDSKVKESSKKNINNNEVNKLKEQIKKNKKISSKKGKYQPQSYKIIFILKDVDPKDPIEELSTILRNSDINFEIEKIERFFDSKNKIINKN